MMFELVVKFLLAFSVITAVSSQPASSNGLRNDPNFFGNDLNFWTKLESGWDLTRGVTEGAITLPVPQNGPIVVQPNTTALVIIDMQNFFLHESLNGDPKGRAIVLVKMPPAFINGFSETGSSQTSFGSDMGTIVVPASNPSIAATATTPKPNMTIEVGRMLFRGSWNAQPYVPQSSSSSLQMGIQMTASYRWGDLFDEQQKGVAAGSDFYFNKNRLSGMWGPGTPMQTWLEDNSMTTLFFGGVNIDQCVWGTLLDSYYKGYDVVLLDDISATTSPSSATQMVDYNANLNGWRANSTDILAAIQKAARKHD